MPELCLKIRSLRSSRKYVTLVTPSLVTVIRRNMNGDLTFQNSVSLLTNADLAYIPDGRAAAVSVAIDLYLALTRAEATLILAEVVVPPGSSSHAFAAVVDVG